MVGSRRRRSCPPVAFHDGGNGFSLGVCPARPIPLRAISEQSGSPAEGPGSGSSFRRQDQQQPQRRLAEASSSAHTSSTRRWQRKRASDTALGPLKMADIALYYGKGGRRDRGREGWEDADSKQEGKKDRGGEPRPMEVSTCVVDLDGSSDGDHGHRVDRHRVGDSDSETKEASVTGTTAEARPVRWQGQEQVERQEQDQSVRTRWQGVNVVRKLRQRPQSLYHTQLSRASNRARRPSVPVAAAAAVTSGDGGTALALGSHSDSEPMRAVVDLIWDTEEDSDEGAEDDAVGGAVGVALQRKYGGDRGGGHGDHRRLKHPHLRKREGQSLRSWRRCDPLL